MEDIRLVLDGCPSDHEDDGYLEYKLLQVPLEELLGYIGSEVFPSMGGAGRTKMEVVLRNFDVFVLNGGETRCRLGVEAIKFLKSTGSPSLTVYEDVSSWSETVDELFYLPYQKRLMKFIAGLLDENLPDSFHLLGVSDDHKTLFVVL